MRQRIFTSVIVCTIATIALAKADPIATSAGTVTGVLLPDGAVRAYKGIPFAKPPIGDLRWRAPQPASPWSGTLVADKFGAICAQPDPLGGNSIFTRLFFIPIEPRSEDCLYLNVWTTASPGDKRPVMVWIPGGGFRGGRDLRRRGAREEKRRARVLQLPPLEVRFSGASGTVQGIRTPGLR
jgi:para-nitrobenzyl esterase